MGDVGGGEPAPCRRSPHGDLTCPTSDSAPILPTPSQILLMWNTWGEYQSPVFSENTWCWAIFKGVTFPYFQMEAATLQSQKWVLGWELLSNRKSEIKMDKAKKVSSF